MPARSHYFLPIAAVGLFAIVALGGAVLYAGSLGSRALKPVSSGYGRYVAPARLTAGQRAVVSWQINPGQPVYPSVKIELCRGRLFGQQCGTLVADTPNDGAASIVVPNVSAGSAALRLTPRHKIKGQLLPRFSIAGEVTIVSSSHPAPRSQPVGGGVTTEGGGSSLPQNIAVNVKIASSKWASAFKGALDPAGARGYLLVGGGEKPLPWSSIDRIFVQFEQPVGSEMGTGNFVLLGTNRGSYPIDTVTYDADSRIATLTLAEPLVNDRLRLQIRGLSQAAAEVRFAVLSGDANQDGTVAENDVDPLRPSLGYGVGEASYDTLADLNGDGGVTIFDVAPIRANLGQSLPS